MVSGCHDGVFREWSLAAETLTREFEGQCAAGAWRVLWCCFPHLRLCLVIFHCITGHTDWIRSCLVLPSVYLSGGDDGKVRCWDRDSGLCSHDCHCGDGSNYMYGLCELGDASGRIAAACKDGVVYVLAPHAASIELSLRGHGGDVRAVGAVPGSNQLVSVSEDSTTRLWDVATASCMKVFHDHKGIVFALAVFAHGDHIATAGSGGFILVRDLHTGSIVARLGETGRRHTGAILNLALGDSNQLLASCGVDGSLFLWPLPEMPLFAEINDAQCKGAMN